MERSTGTLQSNKRKKQVWALLFVAPTILLILILNVWPIIQSIWYSFNDVKGLGKPTWVGMANYFQAFHDPALLKALWNTALYTIVTVPVGTILSLVVAVFLNSKIKGKTFFRVIYFIPVVSAPVAVSMVWKWLYNGQYGLINYFLSFFGLKGPDWIGAPKFALWSIIGYNMVILLGVYKIFQKLITKPQRSMVPDQSPNFSK